MNFLGYSAAEKKTYGPTYFLSHYDSIRTSTGNTYVPDYETVVYTPANGDKYFNDDNSGAYISLMFNMSKTSKTRVFMIGDYTDENGVLHENQLLCYDYNTLSTYMSSKISGASNADVFGFYPKERLNIFVLMLSLLIILVAELITMQRIFLPLLGFMSQIAKMLKLSITNINLPNTFLRMLNIQPIK